MKSQLLAVVQASARCPAFRASSSPLAGFGERGEGRGGGGVTSQRGRGRGLQPGAPTAALTEAYWHCWSWSDTNPVMDTDRAELPS